MDDVHKTESPIKRGGAAWLQRLTGRDTETVIIAKAECNRCKIVGPGVAYKFETGIQEQGATEPEIIVFEGLKLTACGHVWISVVLDDHARRHHDTVGREHELMLQYLRVRNTNDAQRAQKRSEEAERKFKTSTRRAWRKYNDLCTTPDILPVKALVD